MSENQQPLDQEEEQAAPQAEAAAADEDAPVQEENRPLCLMRRKPKPCLPRPATTTSYPTRTTPT